MSAHTPIWNPIVCALAECISTVFWYLAQWRFSEPNHVAEFLILITICCVTEWIDYFITTRHNWMAPIKAKHNTFEIDSVLIFRQTSKGKTSSFGLDTRSYSKPVLPEDGDWPCPEKSLQIFYFKCRTVDRFQIVNFVKCGILLSQSSHPLP